MWYLSDFRLDSRGGSITTINWEEYYFDEVDESASWDASVNTEVLKLL